MPSFCRRLTPDAPIGPSWPVDDTITLHSSTLGSMHICVSWLSETSVQLVTAPATRRPPAASVLTTRSSAAVALKSLTLGLASVLERSVEVISAACLTTT